jgi:Holliday junction resolvase
LKPESKFWKEWKAFTPNILWTRIENMSSLGTPDLLGYNKNKTFFTVELKVTSGNSVRLSPHQIVKSLASSISKLYEGKNIKELAARGLQLDACCLGLDACRLHLESL